MSLSDRDKMELREVVQSALAPELALLRKELAETVVVIIEEFSDDLMRVLAARNEDIAARWRAEREARTDAHKRAGF